MWQGKFYEYDELVGASFATTDSVKAAEDMRPSASKRRAETKQRPERRIILDDGERT